MTQQMDPQVFAAKAKDREILARSSSGGMFTILSDYFLDRDYPVACSIYNYETDDVEYRLVFTREERNAARGSKYVQSVPGDIYSRCAAWLTEHPDGQLLFVGLGCHAAAFRRFAQMKGVLDRATVVDIICHGSPSPMLWKDYIGNIRKSTDGEMKFLTFKDKRNGWRTPTAVAKIGDREISLQEYVNIFYSRCALRPACHHCPYASMTRSSDMTIGDYWHIEEKLPEQYDPMGNSLVLIHSDKGSALLAAVADRLEVCPSSPADCSQPNLERPTPISEQRDRFWREYYRHGVGYIARKYGRTTLLRRALRKIKRLLLRIKP